MTVTLPFVLPWLAAVAMALLDGRRPRVAWAAVGLAAAGFVASVALASGVLSEGPRQVVAGGWPAGIGIVLRADALGVVFAALSSGVIVAALAFEAAQGVRSRALPALTLFLQAGLTGLFLTGDIFNFYVFFELAMTAAYALTAYGEESRQLAAGLIFAVVNLLGSFIFLIAVAGMYHVTGTLEMAAVAARIDAVSATATVTIAVSVFVAFGVKLGLFPFHFWLPSVYAGARPAVAAILAGALANIGAYGLLRFGGEILWRDLRQGATVVIAIGVASILYGSLQAVSRRTAGEVIAYSSIGQAGYVLVALGIGGVVGLSAAVLFALVNGLNKALLFLSVEARGTIVGIAFVIGAFSVAGVPPSAGFFGKLAVFDAAVGAQSSGLVALVFLGSALSFIYMFQIYQHDFWAGRRLAPAAPGRARGLALLLAGLVVAVGLWPEPLLALSRDAAAVLPGGRG